MATKVAQMTTEELRELVGVVVEQKLVALFGERDDGQEVAEALHKRLLRQRRAAAKGESGELFDDVAAHLELD